MLEQHYRPPTSDLCRDTLAVILAGGSGKRLGELTRWHAKPALPFGGHYRNIDFALSNCVNSGVRRIGVLTQYKAHSLIKHVQEGWHFLRPEIGEFIEVWPAQQRTGTSWYAGTADAVQQNIDIIEEHAPAYILLLAGDHVYRMDYLPMLETHRESGAAVTVGSIEVPVRTATQFGVLAVDSGGNIAEFVEKPSEPRTLPGQPGTALASMGIYVFDRDYLVAALRDDARQCESSHDFGHDLMPRLVADGRAVAYPFSDPQTGTPAYWRDVGTVDCYWQANMDLLGVAPQLDLRDPSWPIWTQQEQVSPSQFCAAGQARDSIVANGCRVAGSVEHSILFTGADIGAGAVIEDSLILPGASIGRGCPIRKAIIDSRCTVGPGTSIGVDPGNDRQRYHVSSGGVTLVTHDMLKSSRPTGRVGGRLVA